MQIELFLEGEKKVFVAPFVPMLARRKYLEIQARLEEQKEDITYKVQIEEDDSYFSILPNVVFRGQFTLDDLYNGASEEYAHAKIREAVFGIKPEEIKEEENEGNNLGK